MGESFDGVGEFVSSRPKIVCDKGWVIQEYSADYMQGTRLSFRSKEDAMHFAEKQGVSSFSL